MGDDKSREETGNGIVRLFNGPRPDVPPALEAFTAYWRSKCAGETVPRRAQIDPRGIESLLGNAFIVERIAPGLARMRIAGTHLNDLMGMDIRGMPLSALVAPADRDLLADRLVRLFDEPACLRLDLSSRGSFLSPALRGTMLLLPLRSDLGDISRALGCLVTEGPLGRPPRRFMIDSSTVTPVTQRAPATAPIPAPHRTVDAAASLPPARPAGNMRSHLRLVTTAPV